MAIAMTLCIWKYKIQRRVVSWMTRTYGISKDVAWRRILGWSPSDFDLCIFYDVACYEDDENPGKFFVATTHGTLVYNVSMDVTIPLANSELEAMTLAVEHLGLRTLYEKGYGRFYTHSAYA